MCREDAARIYLDVLLGFRGSYSGFLEAVEVLSAADRMAVETALSGRSLSAATREDPAAFF